MRTMIEIAAMVATALTILVLMLAWDLALCVVYAWYAVRRKQYVQDWYE